LTNWKYEYLVEQIHRTAYKKHENYVIGSLLHDESLSELKPCTQYYVKRISEDAGYALIDIYYPQIKLAVEIDEPHHAKNVGDDEKRQRVVEDDLRCEFIRIDIKKGNVANQIRSLKERINKKVSECKRKNAFEKWVEPRKLDIYIAKKELKNSLLIKIKGEIHPDELMSRQTGYWRIAENKKDKIGQIIVVHNSIVSRVFKNIKWHDSEENQKKSGYTGQETDEDSLVGTIIENWNWQKTHTYSDDVD